MTCSGLARYGIHWENFSTDFPLHRLLATKEYKEEKVFSLIEKGKGLLAQDPIYRLTPLHLAAMTNNVAVAEKLLEKEISELQQDRRGWTARHHAIAQEFGDILDLLSEHDIPTARGWTPDEMQRRMRPIQSQNPFWYKDVNDAAPRLCSAEKFKECTGTIYVDNIFVTRDILLREWNEPHEVEEDDVLATHFQDLTIDDNKVYLAKSKEGVGFGVFARVAIETGTPILRYNGLATTHCTGNYILSDVDGKGFGSLASRVNHSFPNAIFHPIEDGEIEADLVVAVEAIKQDDEICVNYGNAFDNEKFIELRPQAKDAFAVDEKTLQTLDEIANPTFVQQLEKLKLATCCEYLN